MKVLGKLVTLAAGASVGLLFAQRSGKELREKLTNSNDPWGVIMKEAGLMGKEAKDSTVDWVKNSKELQQVIESGKGQFDELVKGAKEMGGDTAEVARQKLVELANNAQEAANELGGKAKAKVSKAKSTVKKAASKTKSTSKKVEKKVKSV